MTTLLELKNRKARLQSMVIAAKNNRRLMTRKLLNEYQTVIAHFIVAERKLLRPGRGEMATTTTTLLELKNRKAVLRSCMEIERRADGEISEKTFRDYELVLAQLRAADSQLLGTRYNNKWLE